MCNVLFLIYEPYTNINNYHSLRVCPVLGPRLSTSQTHLTLRKTLWVLLCLFYKLGGCYQVKLITILPMVKRGRVGILVHVGWFCALNYCSVLPLSPYSSNEKACASQAMETSTEASFPVLLTHKTLVTGRTSFECSPLHSHSFSAPRNPKVFIVKLWDSLSPKTEISFTLKCQMTHNS